MDWLVMDSVKLISIANWYLSLVRIGCPANQVFCDFFICAKKIIDFYKVILDE